MKITNHTDRGTDWAKTGGPAFPQQIYTQVEDGVFLHEGMSSLRWLAGMAMQGLIANIADLAGYKKTAEASYGFALAMLAEEERILKQEEK